MKQVKASLILFTALSMAACAPAFKGSRSSTPNLPKQIRAELKAMDDQAGVGAHVNNVTRAEGSDSLVVELANADDLKEEQRKITVTAVESNAKKAIVEASTESASSETQSYKVKAICAEDETCDTVAVILTIEAGGKKEESVKEEKQADKEEKQAEEPKADETAEKLTVAQATVSKVLVIKFVDGEKGKNLADR